MHAIDVFTEYAKRGFSGRKFVDEEGNVYTNARLICNPFHGRNEWEPSFYIEVTNETNRKKNVFYLRSHYEELKDGDTSMFQILRSLHDMFKGKEFTDSNTGITYHDMVFEYTGIDQPEIPFQPLFRIKADISEDGQYKHIYYTDLANMDLADG